MNHEEIKLALEQDVKELREQRLQVKALEKEIETLQRQHESRIAILKEEMHLKVSEIVTTSGLGSDLEEVLLDAMEQAEPDSEWWSFLFIVYSEIELYGNLLEEDES